MKAIRWCGVVRGGKMSWESPLDKQRYADAMEQWEGKRVACMLKVEDRPRSLPANRYYWSCVVKPLADHCGYHPDEMHEVLATMLLGTVERTVGDRVVTVRKSTSTLSTADFAAYVDRCVEFAETLGVYCPPPNSEAAARVEWER